MGDVTVNFMAYLFISIPDNRAIPIIGYSPVSNVAQMRKRV